ncbi:MAG: DNA-directed RNA polymerase subunit beta, partial [Sphingobacteriia bacterium]|nr:DNA-directed RNA polymerase subunit beta [Sphingobacteriia bacterium]
MLANIHTNNRHSFSKLKKPVDYPDLLEIQIKSFKEFMQLETPPDKREIEGLHKVFQENFPISDARENFVLEFLDYYIDPPKYDIEECKERGLTYAVPLKAKLYLYCTDPENDDFEPVVQEVYLGNIPYMTPSGTFIINGAERVIVSQLHRSPGVFFGQNVHANGTRLYSARIIPFKGSWVEFATDVNNVMYAYIDRKKKFPVTTLLRAIGYSTDKDILEIFGLSEEVKATKVNLKKAVGRKLAARVLKTWNEDFVDEDTGEVVSITRNEVLLERDHILREEDVDLIGESGQKSVILITENANASEYSIIYNTLQKDNSNSEKEAIELIYRQLRNAEAPDEETARGIIDKLFFSDKRYDLGEVGRYRLNKRLHVQSDETSQVLTKSDIIRIVQYIIELLNSKANVDDIDHLSNRRVRTVGEQLYAQFGVGLSRMARTIRERMNIRDNEVFTPADLINARTLSSVINSFFGTNQLSQFMDQTNPLAEITHKRRMSALGPGGLSRERAGFEVRDVHYTHYGRLCPIETPEGPNIGLISSLCVYAKVNHMGFIETPYRLVKDSKVSDDIRYMSAEEEDNIIIAQSQIEMDEKGNITEDLVKARAQGDFPRVAKNEINFMDVAPNQIVSLAASLIPFLEHDDANRALMGSNMQRQAVPLLKSEAPIVGTGIEQRAAVDSRALMVAKGNGIVDYVDGNSITIRYERNSDQELVSFDSNVVTYRIPKFNRTNQSTCVNLKPIVKTGDKVEEGTILVEGYSTERGELALGKNLLVAFMPWQGYNFEDAIVISEKIVMEDVFTSIHIDEYELQVRDTKRGQEELTSEIPNVSEDATRNLDRVGSEVREGDILIGKITPKGETDPTPEEKLLRAIFGDKAGDVKDASLKAPPSVRGVVIDNKLFSKDRKETGKGKTNEKKLLGDLETKYNENISDLNKLMLEKLMRVLGENKSSSVKNKYNEEVIPSGRKFSEKSLSGLNFNDLNP